MRRCTAAVVLWGALASAAPCSSEKQCKAGWEFVGPSTYFTRDDDLRITSAGATQQAVKGEGKKWFIATVNGGVWRTETFDEAVPKWKNVLDGQPVTCSSMSAIHVSEFDPKIVYAGCGGSTSSEQGSDWNVVNSGDWGGVMVSKDSGDTWSMVESFPVNYYVTAINVPAPGILLVTAQSHLFDANEGGIWRSTDSGATFKKVDKRPTFTITKLQVGERSRLLATHPRVPGKEAASFSSDKGETWVDSELRWPAGHDAFYTCAAQVGNTLVAAGMTVLRTNSSVTNSSFFVLNINTGRWEDFPQPTSMDEDKMPKDRMAVLGDPDHHDLMYVSGNAGALAWRVNLTTAVWTRLWDDDVADKSLPHGDCRNFAWDAESSRLILVSDGGIFGRINPRQAGGKWVSLNGDVKQMEFLSAQYDPRSGSLVAGAQDNSAMVWDGKADSVATGFVEGDGTVVQVDAVHNPSRLYGTTQFLGVGTIDIDPENDNDKLKKLKDDDDECVLCFQVGNKYVGVPIGKYFPEPSNFPFFVHPYALNSQDPSRLLFWANGSAGRLSALYEFKIPKGADDPDDIPAPDRVAVTPQGAFVLALQYGGYTNGVADPNLIVAMNTTHLYMRQGGPGGLREHRLPTTFATPVVLGYAAGSGDRILGPVTHGRTVAMSVSPSDSNFVAVTGWGSVDSYKESKEGVWITTNGGSTWDDLTGNVKEAVGVVGKIRPGGVLVMDLPKNGDKAVLLSTANGIAVTYLTSPGVWKRFGSCSEFPIVLGAALSHEPHSDTLVAATFGRGAYLVHNATQAVLSARSCVDSSTPTPVFPEETPAKFFPEMQ